MDHSVEHHVDRAPYQCGPQQRVGGRGDIAHSLGVRGAANAGGSRNHLPLYVTRSSIDDVLTAFFSARRAIKKEVTRERRKTTESRLRECLETEAPHVLITPDIALVLAERPFQPTGAVARLGHSDDLAFGLVVFLHPEWLAPDPLDLRVQLQLCGDLVDCLLPCALIDGQELACPLRDVRAGFRTVRARLRSQRKRGFPPWLWRVG